MALQPEIQNGISLLHNLIVVLSNAMKAKKNRAAKIYVAQFLLIGTVEIAQEIYTPVMNAHALSHTVQLDFGNTCNPEGSLKQLVLYRCFSKITVAIGGNGEASENVPGVTGAMKSVYGVLGMTGVGTTVALQGFAHDEDAKERFDSGVVYMRFGRDATVALAVQEISKIMALTGATVTAEKALLQ